MESRRTDRWHRYWDKKSRSYDREMGFWDRHVFGDSRAWACGRARGDVLEVAVGTGLNLPFYPDTVRLTGVDLSAQMLAIARKRAEEVRPDTTLQEGDAHALSFPDSTFDTVVCTFGLCAIPDSAKAIAEMRRVLRPGGQLILVDHVASSSRPARWVQRVLETVTVPLAGEHFLRRPIDTVRATGFEVEHAERFRLGLVERVVARKR
ncbi:ubiquinone biosynthesis methyltransferase UbiE [Nocardia sp. 852002-20019_SCH5090214]|uniref:class I SAM-dependent methyltransferase n=1 Tax=Nocardia TaxID=1817 RepID=UPI0007A519C1|nr:MULTISPECIES: class I SAM-dependent methyltransferase [Nocardia]MCC3316743.1 class I SAM-dependent methyltransferase [Nocardia africana]OBA50943.1 ubiquinone biosynthesis methyltransferase UbiE [Nocardia sp. 852002-20019_SCH5090214]